MTLRGCGAAPTLPQSNFGETAMRRLILPLLPALILPSPVLPAIAHAAPVEVTRFHTPDSVAGLGRGAVTVAAAPGSDGQSLELQPWLDAVGRELATLGFGAATPHAADRIAEVRLERRTERIERSRGPVSVGVGGATGGWNSGVGLGVGFNLGGGPKARTFTRLSVTIRDRASGRALWEGRAENVESARDRRASSDLAAPRLAHALFTGFPGAAGATTSVR